MVLTLTCSRESKILIHLPAHRTNFKNPEAFSVVNPRVSAPRTCDQSTKKGNTSSSLYVQDIWVLTDCLLISDYLF